MTPPSKYQSKSRKSKIRNTAKYYLFPEGTKTEYKYFDEVELKRILNITNLEVILKEDTSTSDPVNLFKFATGYLKKNRIKPDNDNIVVFVFDLEMGQSNRYERCRQLKNLIGENSDKYRIYISNPCIELWFIMHHERFEGLHEHDYSDPRSCKTKFNELFNGKYKLLYDRLDIARKNARKLLADNKLNDPDPCLEDIIFTTLHLLFEELEKSRVFNR